MVDLLSTRPTRHPGSEILDVGASVDEALISDLVEERSILCLEVWLRPLGSFRYREGIVVIRWIQPTAVVAIRFAFESMASRHKSYFEGLAVFGVDPPGEKAGMGGVFCA